MKNLLIASITVAMCTLDLPTAGNAAPVKNDYRTEQVRFAANSSSAVIKGRLKGNEYIDYRLAAKAGQTLDITIKTTNPQNFFNVNPPESDLSMFIGSTSGNSFRSMLPADGSYTVSVYLMRPAARRNESAGYTLQIGVTGKPLAPLSEKADALIPGTPFHASATITCRHPFDPKVLSCEAFVIRRGTDGTATIEARFADGMKRRILFVKGKPVASDAPDPLKSMKKGDLNIVSLDSDERYEIPDALLTGG
ncbi:hypothetical protein [Chlorobium limicola]|uniref:Peptidase domain protein n=1 Tax=Chlorobium limicola TaxID=1092 RepID=A0A117MRF1_CHLLI|nr:hypothetical protein [Chlorobium limicola]KUL31687.1 hypothetical protein ASB62_02470 [Chlorobium limicola]